MAAARPAGEETEGLHDPARRRIWMPSGQEGTPGGMAREPPAAEGGEPLVIYSVCNNPGGA